ncbi:SDR family NAD(P)-dependent oxidoreductase [Jiangella endophytica]|uniref:SDR family NAD(P)-dependent oxidoreductase n=1 Tax=Jiangella endophytica TaxID=1623398 RepID=UPI000E357600|nr:SDR family oxidoreductase [Jiangella endophytica]
MIDTGLSGKVVLVTGADGGIGEATARAFAAQGARVAVHHHDGGVPAPEGVSFEHRLGDAEAAARAVVNISTDAAQCFPGQVGYGSSKAALEAFTRAAAVELGPAGIRVNAVAPGPVQTGWMSGELVESLLPHLPLGRVGRPSDIADAVVFLASGQASWLTGQVIKVSGGHH